MRQRPSITLQGPMSHWQVSMVTHAFSRHDSAGSGFENITCTPHHAHSRRLYASGCDSRPLLDRQLKRFVSGAQASAVSSVLRTSSASWQHGISYAGAERPGPHPECRRQPGGEERQQESVWCCSCVSLGYLRHTVQAPCQVHNCVIPVGQHTAPRLTACCRQRGNDGLPQDAQRQAWDGGDRTLEPRSHAQWMPPSCA